MPMARLLPRASGDADASVQVGRLSTREWLTLRKLGYAQVEQLAALDLETIESAATATPASQRTQELLAAYLPEVTGIQSPRRRLRDAVATAQMVQDGTDLRRITRGPIAIPGQTLRLTSISRMTAMPTSTCGEC